jgi:hemolysin-activating ACP:hemolysin acyltransferase
MTIDEESYYKESLSHLESILESNISNYALDDSEELYDEDNDLSLRALKWSRGDKEWYVVITPFGQIRSAHKDAPHNLIIQISNTLVDVILEMLWRKEDEYERKNEENRLLRRGILQKD